MNFRKMRRKLLWNGWIEVRIARVWMRDGLGRFGAAHAEIGRYYTELTCGAASL